MLKAGPPPPGGRGPPPRPPGGGGHGGYGGGGSPPPPPGSGPPGGGGGARPSSTPPSRGAPPMHTAPLSPAPGSNAAAAPNFRVNKPAVKGHARAAQPTGDTGGWKERRTVDGGEYYHNVLTDEVACAHAMHMPHSLVPCTHAVHMPRTCHTVTCTTHAALPPLDPTHATCVQVSWDKPPQLQTAEERQVDTSDCVWLPSEQEATPCTCSAHAVHSTLHMHPLYCMYTRRVLHARCMCTARTLHVHCRRAAGCLPT